MQVFDGFTSIIILAVALVISTIIGYAGARIHIGLWDYSTRNPALQLQNRSELLTQIAQIPMFIFWYVYSIMYLQSLVVFIIGYIGLPIAALIGIGLGATNLEDIPFHVFNYNYKIISGDVKKRRYQYERTLPPKKSSTQFDSTLPNKKQGRRYEYWRGYGRYN